MGTIKIDLANIVTISLVGFIGTFLINRGLRAAGMSNWTV